MIMRYNKQKSLYLTAILKINEHAIMHRIKNYFEIGYFELFIFSRHTASLRTLLNSLMVESVWQQQGDYR